MCSPKLFQSQWKPLSFKEAYSSQTGGGTHWQKGIRAENTENLTRIQEASRKQLRESRGVGGDRLRGRAAGAGPALPGPGEHQPEALPRTPQERRPAACRMSGYLQTAAGTSVLTRTGRSTPSPPLWGKRTPGYTGPAQPQPPPPRPVPAHVGGAPSSRISPSTGGGDGVGGGWRRLTARYRPGNFSHEDVEKPPGAAPRRPRRGGRRHLGSCGVKRGGRPRPGSAQHRPPPPAQNGGGGPDPGRWGGCFPPAFSLLPATRRGGLAGRGGFLRTGGPGNAGLLLPSLRGEEPGGAARCAPSSSRPVRGVVVFRRSGAVLWRCCGGAAAPCSLHLLLPFVLDAVPLKPSCYGLEDAAFYR